MDPNSKLYNFYLVIVILVILSLIYHTYLHGQIQIPEDEKKCKTRTYIDYINKMHSGMLRGVIFGLILNGSIVTAIQNGAVYGTVTPLIMYLGMD